MQTKADSVRTPSQKQAENQSKSPELSEIEAVARRNTLC